MIQRLASNENHRPFVGNTEITANIIQLLQFAATEIERDHDVAKALIQRASMLLRVEAQHRSGQSCGEMSCGGLSGWQIQRVKTFIEENLSDVIRVDQLSTIARLSTAHFSRAFKLSIGQPPHTYIVNQRLKRACRLIVTDEMPLSEVAIACGFFDQAHLCKQFRHSFGKTPAAWRRERREWSASPQYPGSNTELTN